MTIIYKVICRECKKVFETSYFDENYTCHKCTWNPHTARCFIDISDKVSKGLTDKPWWKFW